MALPEKGTPEWEALTAAWAEHRRQFPDLPGPGLQAAFDQFAAAWQAEQEQ